MKRTSGINVTEFDKDNVPQITGEELSEALSRLRLNKASGPDTIPPILIKHFIEANGKHFLIMLNNLITSAEFPDIWKPANLALIQKKSTDLNVRKFRPICMLNSICKIDENIIASRILENLELSPNQFGFGLRHALKP